MKTVFFHSGKQKGWTSFGLLVYRLAFGGMMLTHGIPNLIHFAERSHYFSDPLGVGNYFSLILVIFAEVFCSALVILGLATRIAVIPLIFSMAVAAFIINGGGPFIQQEMPLLYMAAFTLLLFTGAGNVSLDKIISGK